MDSRNFFQPESSLLKQNSEISSPASQEINELFKDNEEKEISLPEEFICPISLEIMRDPVKTSDNFTFERKHIQEWLDSRETSPLTNEILIDKKLESHSELKKIIQQFEENQRVYTSGIPQEKQALLKKCIISQNQLELNQIQLQDQLKKKKQEINQMHESNKQLEIEVNHQETLIEKLEIDLKQQQAYTQMLENELKEKQIAMQLIQNELTEKNLQVKHAREEIQKCKILLTRVWYELRDDETNKTYKRGFFERSKPVDQSELSSSKSKSISESHLQINTQQEKDNKNSIEKRYC